MAEARQQLVSLQRELAQTVSTVSANHERALAELAGLRAELEQATARSAGDHERTLLALRMVRDDDERRGLHSGRCGRCPTTTHAFDEDEPLVSIIITTYRNWPLLRDRSLPSVIAQTYERWEVIVVGDAAPDEARRGGGVVRRRAHPVREPAISRAVPGRSARRVADQRHHALEHGARARPGQLDRNERRRRRPAVELCRVAPDARAETRAEVPYGCIDARPTHHGRRSASSRRIAGQWGLQAALLHAGLRFLPLQPSDWVFDVPNDVSLLERMLRIGVRFSLLDEAVVDYYPSRLWSERKQRPWPRDLF